MAYSLSETWTAADEAERLALEAARDTWDPAVDDHPKGCFCGECRADRED